MSFTGIATWIATIMVVFGVILMLLGGLDIALTIYVPEYGDSVMKGKHGKTLDHGAILVFLGLILGVLTEISDSLRNQR